MYFKNGKIFTEGKFKPGGFLVENGRFKEIIISKSDVPYTGSQTDSEYVDLHGAYVIPGLVDIHIHGAVEEDFSDSDETGLHRIAEYLMSQGVTSFLPTTMTISRDDYLRAAEIITLTDEDNPGREARVLGMRMEGPFLSAEKKGAQNETFIQKPDFGFFQEIQKKSGGNVKIIDIAPEIEGAEDFIRKVIANSKDSVSEKDEKFNGKSNRTVLSLGHSAATYEEAKHTFELGAGHVTHLFNAMNSVHHRHPGMIPAAAENGKVTTEIIADGIHVHESMVRMAFKLFPNRICIISDALRCLGVPDGEYMLSGQKIIKNGGVARLENGTLAGAASSEYDGMLNLIRFGIPVEEAILAATKVPADIIGNKDIGAIEAGRFADFVVCDENLKLKEVYVGGVK